MIGSLMSDVALKQRLAQDCAAHAQAVVEVLAAHTAGELEEAVALRTCALELHSVKGMVSILGLSGLLEAVTPLSDLMMRPDAVPAPLFWDSFRPWFGELIAQITASAHGHVSATASHALKTQGESLISSISHGASPQLGAPPSAPQTPRPLTPSAGRRILLVDDSPTVRAAVAARLTDRGYPVRTARSLTETARVLEEFDPEIVVTDVCMPHVEGDELCRRIKAHMKRLVPVLLYSSLPEEQLAQRARAAGADGYLCKIRGIEALIERMDELLGEEILF